ncbi:hypothetical protein DY245_18680 [Streptomyces inhibens]|uniref:Uncharacterized protein n=1 Tax=Streptomyces inhibens TaxID=2293571 RepID=A0A371Q2C3_STRIH|nr:hypothetical protein DY245_18680 [Streptomyces inhibens]
MLTWERRHRPDPQPLRQHLVPPVRQRVPPPRNGTPATEYAQARWRALTAAAHLVALLRAGARFENGHLVERTEPAAACAKPPQLTATERNQCS